MMHMDKISRNYEAGVLNFDIIGEPDCDAHFSQKNEHHNQVRQ
jgi:hypothetical protein